MAWETPASLTPSGHGYSYTSIAIDSDTGIHISYYDDWPSYEAVKHAYKPYNGAWSNESIALLGATNYRCPNSIAIDRDNWIYVCFDHKMEAPTPHSSLKFTYKQPGMGWSTPEVVDNTATTVGDFCSMKVDNSYGIHISYYDESNTQLKYAYKAKPTGGSSWNRYVVEYYSLHDIGKYTSIALDSGYGVHISYYEATSGYQDLRHAYTWTTNSPIDS